MTTNPSTISIDYVSGDGLPEGDPRWAFAHAAQVLRAVTDQVTEENAPTPTPCGDWSVGEVAGHLIAVLDRVVLAPSGEDILSLPVLVPTPVADLPAAVDSRVEAAREAWTDPATLSTMINVPWGTVPGVAALATWTSEVLTHSWDIATTLGVNLNWPPETAALADAMIATLPAEHRGGDTPFDPAVPVPDDAPAIDRLVGWSGRNPARAAG
ncbi:MAG: TIGR03086 family metal-binding protein [Acidimicrobiales bacterium]